MSKPIEAIEAEVLSLPQADRSRLVDKLIASLERDPEWEAAWSEEADRREERIARGESSWVSGAEATARLRAKLA
ncbi:MAG: addiction module protein [Steroidobacteraceae bacterium]|nr:addiction module protein [Steroidobacteraceae bacterium]MCW5573003.1 addiction module protein [Steroidobacteraceae bacterium]